MNTILSLAIIVAISHSLTLENLSIPTLHEWFIRHPLVFIFVALNFVTDVIKAWRDV